MAPYSVRRTPLVLTEAAVTRIFNAVLDHLTVPLLLQPHVSPIATRQPCAEYTRRVETFHVASTFVVPTSGGATEAVHCENADPEGLTRPCQEGFGGCTIVPPPSCAENSGTASNGRKVAYYQSWNTRDRLCNKVMPSQIKTDGLTHLNFAFASIDPMTFQIVTANPEDEQLYPEFTALKSSSLETWIAVGGFDFSDPGSPTYTTWSEMCWTSANRAAFISSVLGFLQKWGFQGLDIDWEYPASPVRGGQPEDTANLVLLVKELRAAFGTSYGLSSILAPDYWYLRGMDPKGMEPYVDFFGFMAYDLHGFWDAYVPTIGAMIRPQTDIRDIQNDTLRLWFDNIDPSKVNLGLAYYGRGYTVTEPTCAFPGCSFNGASNPGPCTNLSGVMSNKEIEELITNKQLVPELLATSAVKQITWDDQWIGYDDNDTFAMKLAFANSQCLGGTMIWSIDFDSGVGSGDEPQVNGTVVYSTDVVQPTTGHVALDLVFVAQLNPIAPQAAFPAVTVCRYNH
ncbi:hypothetical protein MMC30_005379 [Trapelia coarctata]|nr:hypothetical protein [Trapelia coarctata]